MLECRSLGLQVDFVLNELFYNLLPDRQNGLLQATDKFVVDTIESYEHILQLHPEIEAKCEIIPRAISAATARIQAFANYNQCTEATRVLQVVGMGSRTIQDGFDTFLNIVDLFNANHEDETSKISFLWLDETDLKASRTTPLVQTNGNAINFSIQRIEQNAPLQSVPDADIYISLTRKHGVSRDILNMMGNRCVVLYFSSNRSCAQLCKDQSGISIPNGDCALLATNIAMLLNNPEELRVKQLIAENTAHSIYTTTNRTRRLLSHLNINYVDLEEAVNENKRKAIYFLSPDWTVSGVNTFTINLVRELTTRGYNAKILFTRGKNGNYPSKELMPDVPHQFLQPSTMGRWHEEVWDTLQGFLSTHEQAIVVPNYDYIGSAISPIVPDNIGIVGISHSDDIEHYEHIYRLGHWWNEIIAVSDFIRREISNYNASFQGKTKTIRYGVPLDKRITLDALDLKNDSTAAPIKIVYSGRMIHHQKRVERYVELVSHLEKENINYELQLLGDGPELEMLRTQLGHISHISIPGRVTREEIDTALKECHLFVLLSDFEGLPLSLLEAMTEGCIPVVSDIESGVHEILKDGVNSYICPKDDMQLFAQKIKQLYDDTSLRKNMSIAAYETMTKHELSDKDMTNQYITVFDSIFEKIANNEYIRPPSLSQRAATSGVLPPPWLN